MLIVHVSVIMTISPLKHTSLFLSLHPSAVFVSQFDLTGTSLSWCCVSYVVFLLLLQNYLEVGELDPLNRRLAAQPKPDIIVQGVCLHQSAHIAL